MLRILQCVSEINKTILKSRLIDKYIDPKYWTDFVHFISPPFQAKEEKKFGKKNFPYLFLQNYFIKVEISVWNTHNINVYVYKQASNMDFAILYTQFKHKYNLDGLQKLCLNRGR